MKYKKTPEKKSVKKIVYPSTCGSHESMIDEDYAVFNADDPELVVCTDNRGSYVTLKRNLDNGLMDSYRTVDIESRVDRFKTFFK